MPSVDSLALPAPLDSPWVLGPAAFALWLAVLLIVKKTALGAVRRVAARTAWTLDDVLVRALSPALTLAIVASGLVLLGRILPLPPEWDRAFDVMFAGSVALALVLFADRACREALDRVTLRSPTLQGARGLVLGAARGVIIALGLLIFLDSIGISITPLLASLGVGSLAVALALQETLANLFAGVHVIIDKPIEAGQLVRLESGEEGTVLRVGWRSTWIRTLANNMVVLPNARLAGSVITNYSLGDPQIAVLVPVGVHYDSDLERVERITLEVAREVLRAVEGGVPGFDPLVRFQSFADSGVGLTAVLRARDFQSTAAVRHEFIKRLHARFRREGIVIPFPTRTLDLPPAALRALREIDVDGPARRE
jgi:small-conductance mechanosensitive channel